MSRPNVAELVANAEKATPGPWISRAATDDPSADVVAWANRTLLLVAECPGDEGEFAAEADATFIASADPSTITALCEGLRLAEGALSEAVDGDVYCSRGDPFGAGTTPCGECFVCKLQAALIQLRELIDFDSPDSPESSDGH